MPQDYNGFKDVHDTYARYSTDSAEIYALTHQVCKKHVAPIIDEYEAKKQFPQHLWKIFGDAGLTGAGFPVEYGGLGMDLIAEFAKVEAMSEFSGAIALSDLANFGLCGNQVSSFGTDEQKAEYLPRLCAGDIHGGLSITEPDYGSDAFGIKSSGKRDGDNWVVNLRKTYNTNIKTADVIFTYLNTGSDPNARELTAFLIDKDPAITFIKNEKLSMMSSDTDQMFAEDHVVSDKKRVGGVGEGKRIMAYGLPKERTLLAAQSIGMAQGAYNHTMHYLTNERKQFGQRLIDIPVIRHQMTEIYGKISLARYSAIAICQQAALAKEEKDADAKYQFLQNKHGALLKNELGEMALDVIQKCIIRCGAYGLTSAAPLMRYQRDAMLTPIGGGADNICNLAAQRDIMPKPEKN